MFEAGAYMCRFDRDRPNVLFESWDRGATWHEHRLPTREEKAEAISALFWEFDSDYSDPQQYAEKALKIMGF